MTCHYKVQPDEIRRLADEGYSKSTIATLVGVSQERIRQICNRDGIVITTGHFDTDKREALLALSGSQMTMAEAVKSVGYKGAGYLAKLFDEAGLPRPKARTQRDAIREMAEAGLTLTATAKALGSTPQNVWTQANRIGVKFKAREKPLGNKRKWAPEMRAALLAEVESGVSITGIAQRNGVTVSSLYYHIARAKA